MPKFNKRSTIPGLMLTLKESERIIVNNGELRIEIVQIKGKYIRAVFQADKEISIKREMPTEGKV